MAKRHLRLIPTATVNRTVRPKRPPNADLRSREYLTEAEVGRAANESRQRKPAGATETPR
jgi:hypothetical protein